MVCAKFEPFEIFTLRFFTIKKEWGKLVRIKRWPSCLKPLNSAFSFLLKDMGRIGTVANDRVIQSLYTLCVFAKVMI